MSEILLPNDLTTSDHKISVFKALDVIPSRISLGTSVGVFLTGTCFIQKIYAPPPLPYFKVNIFPFPLPHFGSIFFAYL